jgi:hypothetical protein
MELQQIYEAAGRPGAAKLRDAARRQGRQITLKEAQDFLRGQSTAQVFGPPPRSDGKVTSPQLNDRWQCDLMDFKTRTPEKNKVLRAALLCVDVFSRFAYAEPLQGKTASEVAEAFQRILVRVSTSRRVAGKKAAGRPNEVSTDGGNEFKGAFSELLSRLGIAQTWKTSINSLAVVDATTRTLKDITKKDMTAKNSESCVDALPGAVKAYNSNSHSGVMNAAPADVPKSNVLQYELEKQAGYDQAQNTKVHQDRVARLQAAGAFRALLPRSTWTRTGQPRYSDKVYTLQVVSGQEAVATDGSRHAVRDVLPVPQGSTDVQVPRELKGGRPIRDEGAKAALRPFATALKGMLGGGSITLQMAGTRLRAIPGFSEAMAGQKLAGIGALKRFIDLFPEIVVEGRAPKATVRLAGA